MRTCTHTRTHLHRGFMHRLLSVILVLLELALGRPRYKMRTPVCRTSRESMGEKTPTPKRLWPWPYDLDLQPLTLTFMTLTFDLDFGLYFLILGWKLEFLHFLTLWPWPLTYDLWPWPSKLSEIWWPLSSVCVEIQVRIILCPTVWLIECRHTYRLTDGRYRKYYLFCYRGR